MKTFFDKPLVEDWGTITAKSGTNNPKTGKCGMGKHQKPQHHHKPVIERTLPLEQIVSLFNRKFDEPYLNPIAELGFDAFTAAFPDISREVLEEALAYWTNHSGQKVLQTKFVEGLEKDPRVWYLHGLSKPSQDFSSSSAPHASSH